MLYSSCAQGTASGVGTRVHFRYHKDESKPTAYSLEQLPSLRVGVVPITLLREENGKINPLKVMKCSHILVMRLCKYLR